MIIAKHVMQLIILFFENNFMADPRDFFGMKGTPSKLTIEFISSWGNNKIK